MLDGVRRVILAAVFHHNFDIGQPKGGRIFHNNVALLIERKLPLWGLVGVWLDLGIRVRIGEIERTDFAAIDFRPSVSLFGRQGGGCRRFPFGKWRLLTWETENSKQIR